MLRLSLDQAGASLCPTSRGPTLLHALLVRVALPEDAFKVAGRLGRCSPTRRLGLYGRTGSSGSPKSAEGQAAASGRRRR